VRADVEFARLSPHGLGNIGTTLGIHADGNRAAEKMFTRPLHALQGLVLQTILSSADEWRGENR
jgi:hypothetical protein